MAGGHLWSGALSWHEVALAIAWQSPPAPGPPDPPVQAPLPASPAPFYPPPIQNLHPPACVFAYFKDFDHIRFLNRIENLKKADIGQRTGNLLFSFIIFFTRTYPRMHRVAYLDI